MPNSLLLSGVVIGERVKVTRNHSGNTMCETKVIPRCPTNDVLLVNRFCEEIDIVQLEPPCRPNTLDGAQGGNIRAEPE
jgi:hypothetical protein